MTVRIGRSKQRPYDSGHASASLRTGERRVKDTRRGASRGRSPSGSSGQASSAPTNGNRSSEFALVGEGDEAFESRDMNIVGVFEVIFEAAADVESPECPTLAAEDEISLRIRPAANCLG